MCNGNFWRAHTTKQLLFRCCWHGFGAPKNQMAFLIIIAVVVGDDDGGVCVCAFVAIVAVQACARKRSLALSELKDLLWYTSILAGPNCLHTHTSACVYLWRMRLCMHFIESNYIIYITRLALTKKKWYNIYKLYSITELYAMNISYCQARHFHI